MLTAIRRWRSEQKVSPGRPLRRVRLGAGKDVHQRLDAARGAVRAAGRVEDLLLEEDLALDGFGVTILEVEPEES